MHTRVEFGASFVASKSLSVAFFPFLGGGQPVQHVCGGGGGGQPPLCGRGQPEAGDAASVYGCTARHTWHATCSIHRCFCTAAWTQERRPSRAPVNHLPRVRACVCACGVQVNGKIPEESRRCLLLSWGRGGEGQLGVKEAGKDFSTDKPQVSAGVMACCASISARGVVRRGAAK